MFLDNALFYFFKKLYNHSISLNSNFNLGSVWPKVTIHSDLRGSRALPGRMFPDEQLCRCLTSWFCRWKLMLGAEIEAQGPPGFAHSGMWRGHPGLTCLSQLRRSHRPRCPRAGRGCGQPTRLLVRCRRPSLTCAQRAPSRPWRSRWKAPL